MTTYVKTKHSLPFSSLDWTSEYSTHLLSVRRKTDHEDRGQAQGGLKTDVDSLVPGIRFGGEETSTRLRQ